MKAATTTKATAQQVLTQVATNLFCSDLTNIYCAILKREGRQVKRSLKTADWQIACRWTGDLCHRIDTDVLVFLPVVFLRPMLGSFGSYGMLGLLSAVGS
jgi:hypothetical protein